MKRILLTLFLFIFSGCASKLHKPIKISSKDSVSEMVITFTKYRESTNDYYGTATIKNLSINKNIKISSKFGFVVKNKNKNYMVYIDSVADILLDIYPLKSTTLDIVAPDFPKDINFDELEIDLGFQT